MARSMATCRFPHAHVGEWEEYTKRHKQAYEAALDKVAVTVKQAQFEVKEAARQTKKGRQDSVTARTTLSNHSVAIELGLAGETFASD